MIARALIVACLPAFLAALPEAQTRGGSISGVVVTADQSAQPVRRAVVTLTGGDIATNLSVITDDSGRFVFMNLDAGRYTVTASKPAYLSSAYGATRPGRPGTPIAVTASAPVEIRLALWRGAVITGMVRDLTGQPASGVQVTVSRASELNAASGFRLPPEAIITDDRGVYRAYGLVPGEYIVSALPPRAVSLEIFKASAADIDVLFRSLAQPGGIRPPAGSTAGAPVTSVGGPPAIPGSRTASEAFGFSPTFHPGTTVAADATRIAVAAGEERSGVDIPLIPVRAARIEGTLITGDIPPTRIRPTLTVIGPSQPTFVTPALSGPQADGTFAFTGVTPGRYVLVARTGPGAMMSFPAGGGGTTNNPDVPSLFAMQELSVDGTDIKGIALALRPAVSISGRVAFDKTSLTPPETLTTLRVGLTVAPGATSITPVADSPTAGTVAPPNTSVQPDASFKFTGVMPGTYLFNSSVPGAMGPTGWWLRSVIVNGRDVLDHPLEVDPAITEITGVVLTFSDRHSELTGTLTTAAGQPASEFVVVVFSADRSHWRPQARRVKTTRPSSDGSFSVIDLPAGDYLIAALTDIEPDEWQQPAFLEALVPAAVKITIADGQKVRQDLRIAR
jgi:uncharacterized protein (DUF2141 family)